MMKKRLKQKLKDMSIVKKFRCAVIIMIVIPMIMIFSVIFFYSYTELENKMIENSRISMKQAQRSIQSIVEETEYLSLSMLIDDNIQNLCKQYALENTMLDSAKRSLYVSMQDAVKLPENRVRLRNWHRLWEGRRSGLRHMNWHFRKIPLLRIM